MMRALLLTSALYDASSGAPLVERWDRIYAPTAFYVGTADDVTPAEIYDLAKPIYGPALETSALADPARFDRFAADAAKALRAPRIAGSVGDQISGAVQGREFRLMGQRFVLDSRIFQEVTYPKVGETANDASCRRGSTSWPRSALRERDPRLGPGRARLRELRGAVREDARRGRGD